MIENFKNSPEESEKPSLLRRILMGILYFFVSIVTVAVLLVSAYYFFPNQTIYIAINSPVSRWATLDKQADPDLVWKQILTHKNPPDQIDNFDGDEFSPVWTSVFLNGKGIVTSPPNVHAANAFVKDGHLNLQVLFDPEFWMESNIWQPGQAGAETYNNAFLIGFAGYSPTPEENIEIETKFQVSPGFHGSTGLWFQEEGTFDPVTGIMIKPFRSFGISFLGLENDTFLKDVQLEASVGFFPVCAHKVNKVDVTQENVYKMIWSVESKTTMKVDLYVNGEFSTSCSFPSFYKGELQPWADNYDVTGITLSRQNIPEGTIDQNSYDYISVKVIKK